jgi:hypothetical protein
MKRQNQLNIKRGLLSKLVLLVALFLGSSNAWGETVTVCSGSDTNSSIPFNKSTGSTSTTYNIHSQFIIPSTELGGLTNIIITGLVFETSQEAIDLKSVEYDIFLGEVNYTTFTSETAYVDWGSLDNVYSGTLSNITSNKLSITLATSYKYNGRNLLIGFKKKTAGTSSPSLITWIGKNQTGNSAICMEYSNNVQKFLPKMTITYEVAALPTLSISPEEDATFGNVTADATKSYTITNNSGETVNVVPTISGTGASSFSVTDGDGAVIDNSGKDIASGATETFKVKFTYNPEDLNNEKTATITFTPDEDAEEAITINASAKAILDAPLFELSYEGGQDAALGEVTTNASKTYTVRNAGTQPMTVNISLSGASSYYSLSSADFTEGTTNIENIAADESKEFTVTFNYPSPLTIDELTERTATITVTPTYNPGLAETINASATVVTDVVFDEKNATTWDTKGSKSILVKIQPQTGWNTFCFPLFTSTYKENIFGPCTIYELNSYSDDGVISFSKVTGFFGANRPCLVYVESAPDNSKGVLLTGITISTPSTATPGTVGPKENNVGGSATFKGTFAPIAAPGMNGKYGITNAGKLGKGNESASIKGFRAYLEVTGDTPARIMTIDSEGETTDLGFVRMVDQEAKDVYNLQGQKVEKGRKGIYIVNGKKVVIK